MNLIHCPGFVYTPLRRVKPDRLRYFLRDHPDKELVNYLVEGFTHGFHLGMNRAPTPRPPCDNSRAVQRKPAVTQALVDEEIAKGHILGPFDRPPLEDMVYSPLNIVPKGDTEQYRLIHDLAFPYDTDQSVNSCIPREWASVQYHYIDEVINIAVVLGRECQGARIDILSAFRNQPMSRSMLRFLGFTLNGKIYINCCLPFGAASSCFIFEKVATALQWIVSNETGCYYISHFLDDFPLLHKSCESLTHFMHEFYRLMADIGMPVAVSKTLGPTPVLEYLGLTLNFLLQSLTIPEKKRQKCLDHVSKLLQAHAARRKVTIKQIQQAAGSLNFICQALPAGRVFLSGLYRLTRAEHGRTARAGHHRRLNAETAEDLAMFRQFLDECAGEFEKSVPFLHRLELDSSDLELFADSAGSAHLGLGCTFRNEWCQGFWSETELFHNNYKPNIALLELLAIVLAVETWAAELAGKSIVLRSDNIATVAFINRMRADIPAAMQLLRHLTKTCLHFQIYVKARHIEGDRNIDCDLLSRGRLRQYLQRNPAANPTPLQLPATLWPPSWSISQMESSKAVQARKQKDEALKRRGKRSACSQ